MSDIREFKPGLYKHFKGGLYYAAFTAFSHEAKPENLTGEEVIYYSYEKKHWRRRPVLSSADLPDDKRDGFMDQINREGYVDGTFRFGLVQAVPLHRAMRVDGDPWIPFEPNEKVKIAVRKEKLSPEIPKRVGYACLDLNGMEMTVSAARAKLAGVLGSAGEVDIAEGAYIFVARLWTSTDNHRYSIPLMDIKRSGLYPPAPYELE